MREIEFRGKSVVSNKWVYGWLNATKESLKNNYYWIDVDEDSYQVDPETIGQYTGLKDKNGKKIYEGDIVRKVTYDKMAHISKYKNKEEFENHKNRLIKYSKCIFDTEYEYHQNDDYEVKWELNGFYPFADSPYNCGHCGCAEDNEEMEVVGNIYDNPELK